MSGDKDNSMNYIILSLRDEAINYERISKKIVDIIEDAFKSEMNPAALFVASLSLYFYADEMMKRLGLMIQERYPESDIDYESLKKEALEFFQNIMDDINRENPEKIALDLRRWRDKERLAYIG